MQKQLLENAKTIVRVLNNKDRLATGMTCQSIRSVYMEVCVISVWQMSTYNTRLLVFTKPTKTETKQRWMSQWYDANICIVC